MLKLNFRELNDIIVKYAAAKIEFSFGPCPLIGN